MTKIQKDKEDEKKIHKLLEKVLYSNAYKKDIYVIDENDEVMQRAGVDVIATNADASKVYYLDEKATRYHGKDHMQSYFLELTVKGQDGWFVKPNKLTTHYVICWYNDDDADNIKYHIVVLDNKKLEKIYNGYKNGEQKYKQCRYATGPAPERSKLFIMPMDVLNEACVYFLQNY